MPATSRIAKSLALTAALIGVSFYWIAFGSNTISGPVIVVVAGIVAFFLIHDWFFEPLQNQIRDLERKVEALEQRERRH